jgi:hypothetical protein
VLIPTQIIPNDKESHYIARGRIPLPRHSKQRNGPEIDMILFPMKSEYLFDKRRLTMTKRLASILEEK